MTAHRPRETGDSYTLIEVLFSGVTARPRWRVAHPTRFWQPPTDIYETEDALVVCVEIAGVEPEDFQIELRGRVLSISGFRADPHPEQSERRAFYQMELQFGEFRTKAKLPSPVDEAHIEAEYGNGFLRVTLPKLRPTPINE